MRVCPAARDDDATPVLPAQFFDRHHELSGTQRLLLAVLLDAFAALHHRRASVRADARAWLTATTWYAPRITVEMVATGLDIEIGAIIRCAEQAWRPRRQRATKNAISAA